MAASGARARARLQPLHLLSAVLLAMLVAAPAAADPPTSWPDRILVFMDQARLVQLPERAANVVIGNPLIADVAIQPGGLTVITGKGYGITNFVATDKKGAVLFEKAIEVSGPRERTLVIYNGPDRQTYSCTPDCSRRLTLGDTPDSFDKTLAEITARNTQATAAGALGSGQIQLGR
jgi:Pilus formation protein N terminal region